ncbi:hypothetical protein FTX61_09840 [Nitriliruptoraceae bacterium ZYF776]|nr:hypothetical protein [Profundirhabdus halotolerans]
MSRPRRPAGPPAGRRRVRGDPRSVPVSRERDTSIRSAYPARSGRRGRRRWDGSTPTWWSWAAGSAAASRRCG